MDTLVDSDRTATAVASEQNKFDRYTFLGIAATAVGTFLAVSAIPADLTSKDALVFPATIMACGLAAAPMLAALWEPRSLLRPEHVLALSPLYWLLLELLQGLYSLQDLEPESITRAFIAIGVFVACVWLGAYRCRWRLPRSFVKAASQELGVDTIVWLAVAAFTIGFLRFAIPVNFNFVEMVYYLGQGRWNAPWGRGQLGGWDAFLDQLQYFGYLLPTLTAMVAHRVGWRNPRTILCSVMTVIIALLFAQSGSRRIVGVMFAMAAIVWTLSQPRLRTKQMIVLAVSAVALLIALEIMLEYRGGGLGIISERSDYDPLLEHQAVRIDNNFYTLCKTIEFIPRYYPHTYLDYVIFIIVRPVPRVFWPDKPLDMGFNLVSALGLSGLSLSMSVIGELYMAAGLIGIILGGLLYGRIAGMANNLLLDRKTDSTLLFYAILTMSLFAGVRSMIELVLMNYVMIAWVGLTWVILPIIDKKVP
jgi:oligosaccharide repeat unit polymerase